MRIAVRLGVLETGLIQIRIKYSNFEIETFAKNIRIYFDFESNVSPRFASRHQMDALASIEGHQSKIHNSRPSVQLQILSVAASARPLIFLHLPVSSLEAAVKLFML